MSDRLKSILFTLVVALVCSMLLTGASTGLMPFKLRNQVVDRQKNILKSVGLIDEQKQYDAPMIEALYHKNIDCFSMAENGAILVDESQDPGSMPVCFFKENDSPKAYILPLQSKGLWGKINGYIAIEADGETLAGFSVYSHNETPGLGGEIEKNWFRSNFAGKKIVDRHHRFAGISIAKGKVAEAVASEKRPNFVDGISGATLTGKFLTGGLHETLKAYEPLSEKFRNGRITLPATN